MLQIRFPAQFDDAYLAKYGGTRKFYSRSLPTMEISYALAEDDQARRNQIYHKEKMDANRKYLYETIAGQNRRLRTYPCFPSPDAEHLPRKHITSGSAPLATSSYQPPFPPSERSLATFPQHERMRGGVLKDYSYARKILDRRAKDILAQQNPTYQPPPTAPLTEDEEQILFLNNLLEGFLDLVEAGLTETDETFKYYGFGQDIYSIARRLVGALIKTVPIFENPDDLADIYKVIQKGAESLRNLSNPEAHRAPITNIKEQLRKEENKLNRLSVVIDRLGSFVQRYILNAFPNNVVSASGIPSLGVAHDLKDRITIARALAKDEGLLKLAVFTSPKEIKRSLAEAGEGGTGGEGGDEGAPPPPPDVKPVEFAGPGAVPPEAPQSKGSFPIPDNETTRAMFPDAIGQKVGVYEKEEGSTKVEPLVRITSKTDKTTRIYDLFTDLDGNPYWVRVLVKPRKVIISPPEGQTSITDFEGQGKPHGLTAKALKNLSREELISLAEGVVSKRYKIENRTDRQLRGLIKRRYAL